MSEVKKFDQEKVDLSLLPTEAIEEIAKVLMFGAQKYDAHNWRNGFDWTRLSNAVLRHMYAWMRGEDKDPESGLSHLAHAGCSILFLITHELQGLGKDDRFRPEDEVVSHDEIKVGDTIELLNKDFAYGYQKGTRFIVREIDYNGFHQIHCQDGTIDICFKYDEVRKYEIE